MRWILAFPLFFSTGMSGIPDDLFTEGNDAMIQEQYEDAIQAYESLLELGYENSDLFYNLGNGYYRLHYIGQAIWSYSKALDFAPRDRDIQHNLAVSKARRIDRINMPEPFFLLHTYRNVKSNFTLAEWVLIGSLVLLIQAMWVFGLQFGWIRGMISQSMLTAILVLTLSVHGIALDKYFQEKRTNTAVVIANGVDAYSGPFYGENTVLFRINEGSIADIHQTQKDWVEIILMDGKKGWIPAESMRSIK